MPSPPLHSVAEEEDESLPLSSVVEEEGESIPLSRLSSTFASTKEKYLADLSRVNTEQEYYQALSTAAVQQPQVEDRREPLLRGRALPAIEYQPRIRELS